MHKVAEIFRSIANILEIKGENPFKIRAYERAAQNIENLAEDLEELAARDDLEKIPGIGKELAKKIREILTTGTLQYYEELKKEVPPELVTLMSVPGVGPRTAKVLYDELKIRSLAELEEMARAHRLRGLPGIKAKTEENILRGIQLLKAGRERVPLGTALPLATAVAEALRKSARVDRLEIAGSIRRRKETIKDIDILATGPVPDQIMDAFIRLPMVKEVLARGETKASVLSVQGLQIDLRVVAPESFGAALCYFTGSKEHNIRIRELAIRKGLKINEYGVFRDGERLGGETEQDVYDVLGLPFIPPELREDAGEIEAAQKGQLPNLVQREQIRGDLHVHSRFSDGSGSLEDIAAKARSLGLSWIGICDHSRSLKIARGLSIEALMQKCEAIKQFNERVEDVKLLCGAEVDIDAAGQLDYPDEVLARLDLVIAAIHSGFKQDEETQTRRLLAAIRHPYVHIVAHPTGRLFGEREGYPVRFEEILAEARRTGTCLEINAYYKRLDLDSGHVRAAKNAGVVLGIGTDAHILDQMDAIDLGVAIARRGWLEPGELLNTLSYEEVLRFLQRKKSLL